MDYPKPNNIQNIINKPEPKNDITASQQQEHEQPGEPLVADPESSITNGEGRAVSIGHGASV